MPLNAEHSAFILLPHSNQAVPSESILKNIWVYFILSTLAASKITSGHGLYAVCKSVF